eukprot:CAMPEP_0184860508 /NCGR_PEP_ID=MMETSP0580-20130426/5386_1 /TAXON_ID=1118495 /ORGANISM="Dactyliosolen fragilissimus" /LENGTH=382 /DNA_ID=CAMNT_0027357643 /DNA_START=194 /DNA_END=1342 /DNA_ORIENTATION=+
MVRLNNNSRNEQTPGERASIAPIVVPPSGGSNFVPLTHVQNAAADSILALSPNNNELHLNLNLNLNSDSDLDSDLDSKTIIIIFIHGLDSSSHTWRNVLSSLETPAFAIDCRGCGKSPLGRPHDFTRDAIVEDLRMWIDQHLNIKQNKEKKKIIINNKNIVLVGHSMGGRIAIEYSAKYPQHVNALVIEDMDIRRRFLSENKFSIPWRRDETLAFQRQLNASSPQEVVNLFVSEGYPTDMVQKWLQEGRVSKHIDTSKDENTHSHKYYYSQVNPAFRLLCYEQFCDNESTLEAWKSIAQNNSNIRNKDDSSIPFIYIMVADTLKTICDLQSIDQMEKIMKQSGQTNITIKHYPGAAHSIHNSMFDLFVNDIKNIILSCEHHC